MPVWYDIRYSFLFRSGTLPQEWLEDMNQGLESSHGHVHQHALRMQDEGGETVELWGGRFKV